MFRGSFFYDFVANSVRYFFFYRPVNADKLNFVSFLVFGGVAASVTAKISSYETVGKREALFNPVPKERISKDIPNYRSQKSLSTDW